MRADRAGRSALDCASIPFDKTGKSFCGRTSGEAGPKVYGPIPPSGMLEP